MDDAGRGAGVGSLEWLLTTHEHMATCAATLGADGDSTVMAIHTALRILSESFSCKSAWLVGPLAVTPAGQESVGCWAVDTDAESKGELVLAPMVAQRIATAAESKGATVHTAGLREGKACAGEVRYSKRGTEGRTWIVGMDVGSADSNAAVLVAFESLVSRLVEIVERGVLQDELTRVRTIGDAVWQRSKHGLALVSSNGACVRANRVASTLAGHPEGEMVHLAAREWLPAPLGLTTGASMSVAATSGTWQGRLLSSSGEEHFVEIGQSQISCPDEMLTLVQMVDRSDYAALQSQLENLQRHRLMGRLSSGVVHDLNNLLTVVVAALEAAERDPSSQFLPEMISDGNEAVRRCESLCRQLLTMGSRRPGVVRVIPPDPTIAGMRKLLERTVPDDAEFSLSLRASGACISLPGGALEQILLTLLVNAREAMGALGNVVVSTSVEDERFHLMVADLAGGDQERGSSLAQHILESGWQHAGAAPSGLALVQTLVAQVGGQLDVQNVPGKGTTFDVSFALATEESLDSEHEVLPGFDERIPGDGKIILLCENEAVLRDVIQRSLSQHGYEVVSSSDGRRGLELIEGGFAIDALVTDLVMPNVGGAEIAQACNRGGRQTPVVFVSGLLEREAMPKTGAPTQYLAKPFRMHDLLGALQAVLQGSSEASR